MLTPIPPIGSGIPCALGTDSQGQGKVYPHPHLTCPVHPGHETWQWCGVALPYRIQPEICAALPLWLQARPGCGQAGKGLLVPRQGWEHRAVDGCVWERQDLFGITLSPGWTPLPWQCLPGSATSGTRLSQTPPVCQCQLLQEGSIQAQTASGKGWAELGHVSGGRLQESLGAEIGQLNRNETHPIHVSYRKPGITFQPGPLVFSSPSEARLKLLQLFHTYFVLLRIHHKVQCVLDQIQWQCRDSRDTFQSY